MHRVAPTWLLTSGFVLMSVGCLLCTRLDVTDLDVSVFVLPDLLIGVGFALCVSSVTAVALDSVPPQLAGMASATTNMLRDLGFALGPVVVGAVALSKAGMAFSSNLGGADLPTDHLGAARGIAAEGGPIAVTACRPAFRDRQRTTSPSTRRAAASAPTAFLICGIAAALPRFLPPSGRSPSVSRRK
ncbi:hypothetical protein [Streptomyces sp. NPDC056663]|uniref:hypothetical protein n=1 Tax=Streptomyces sp. NPDC056663 TaxID=3345899 RepID=UPI0036B8A73B